MRGRHLIHISPIYVFVKLSPQVNSGPFDFLSGYFTPFLRSLEIQHNFQSPFHCTQFDSTPCIPYVGYRMQIVTSPEVFHCRTILRVST